ncbi:hypothetical protein [Bradyrhizobium jicamae]|uniref:hypothetical protein n=1 Tax=Bradyrhizobium jicamae TaxID=280332 RepID=UPI001BA4A698|nr:hypothetical protein [Bradyrhizobium jicamae]MBR0939100.1 hypothetical protein [Bradyrhizobium jicamae]
MHYSEFNMPTQFGLIGLIVVVGAGLLTRTAFFFRHERTGVRPLYPSNWNATQCRTLERFRLLIGLGLATLWATYLFVVSSMPPNRQYEYLAAILLIMMLSVSYAWAVLLSARDWSRLNAIPHSFTLLIALLVVWWGTAFSAIGWTLTEASTAQELPGISDGVYADRGASTFEGPTIICPS